MAGSSRKGPRVNTDSISQHMELVPCTFAASLQPDTEGLPHGGTRTHLYSCPRSIEERWATIVPIQGQVAGDWQHWAQGPASPHSLSQTALAGLEPAAVPLAEVVCTTGLHQQDSCLCISGATWRSWY